MLRRESGFTAKISGMTSAAPYQNATLPTAERIADLIARMSLPENVGQMLQLDARHDVDGV